jgi:hypothetical protein
MSTKNSDIIANYEAVPSVVNRTQEFHGRLRVAQGSLELATGDLALNDLVMLVPLPANASVASIRLAADDLDSGSVALLWDVGLYTKDGVVVSADCYASDITLGQAATAFTEYAFEARNISACGQMVWEDAGATSDPGGIYYVGMLVATAPATAAAGTLSFIIEYVID